MVFGLQTQPKSWRTGYTFWVNHYLEISVVNPPLKEVHESEAIREAFISGLQLVDIRQRLLESDKTDLTAIHSLAKGLEVASVQAQSYSQVYGVSVNAVTDAEGC